MSPDELWSYICGLREDLGHAETSIAALENRVHVLEDRVHNHEMTVPHAESQA